MRIRRAEALPLTTPDQASDDHALAPLRFRDFRYYTFGRLFSGVASTLLQAAIGWQVYQISGSTLQLGLIGLMRFLPQLALTLHAGAVADTYDRRKIVLLAQITPFTCSLALLFLTVARLINLPWMYALLFFIALGTAFDQPARQALLPQLVPLSIFPRAVTANSTIGQLAFVAGPVLGGLLIARFTVAGAYLAYACLVVASTFCTWQLRTRFAPGSRRRVTAEAIREGISFVRHHQAVLGAMTLDMFGVIFGGAVALLPVYATKILHVGAGGYGILTSSLGIGALAMSVILLFLPQIKRAGLTLLYAVAVYGLMTIIFGLSRSFWLTLLAYALTGAADQVSVVMRQATIQLGTPDELRGRVSAVNSLFIGASGQVGAIESGLVAAITNATFSVVSGGAACIGIVGVVAVTMPGLRRYRIDDPIEHEQRPARDSEAGGMPRDSKSLNSDQSLEEEPHAAG
jgi:MFS family permease